MIIHPWYQLGYIIPHLQTDMDAYQFYNKIGRAHV